MPRIMEASMRPVDNKLAPQRQRNAKNRTIARFDPTGWWALSLGIAAGAAALLIMKTTADGDAAAGVLACASVMIGMTMMIQGGDRSLG
jgi:hypothetical protein